MDRSAGRLLDVALINAFTGSDMQRITLQINGMSCGHCVAAVKQALSEVPGVEIENVAIGQAVISYAPEKTRPTDITAALADAGYEAYAKP